MKRLLKKLLRRRKPRDRWPAWRPDQILTPENRSMTGIRSRPTQTVLDVLESRGE